MTQRHQLLKAERENRRLWVLVLILTFTLIGVCCAPPDDALCERPIGASAR